MRLHRPITSAQSLPPNDVKNGGARVRYILPFIFYSGRKWRRVVHVYMCQRSAPEHTASTIFLNIQ